MEDKSIRLEGVVDSIVFQNHTNGYIVFNLDLENGEEPITVVGELGEVKEGENLIVEGEYSNHARFGTQFKATYCEVKLPQNTNDITKYLASGIIKGVGYATAKKIVDTFGNFTFNIIENQPERLTEIKGISKNKAIQISKDFKKIFNLKQVVKFLNQFKVKASVGMKAFQKWNFETLEKIKDNPYILCENGIDLSFQDAEKIAQFCEIEPTSNKRIFAGFSYVLMNATLDGNSCLPKETFLSTVCRTLKLNLLDIKNSFSSAINENIIIEYTDNQENKYIYLQDCFNAENYIAKKISKMNKITDKKTIDFTNLIKDIELEHNIVYGQLQIDAINMALNSDFMILTGAPGTGKTTTLKAIILMLKSMGMNVKITAPTGRASKRISEVTGYEATTIHRLLEVVFDEDGNQKFFHNEKNPIKCDVVVVDETSMVDIFIFEALLKALKPSCKIILVGDANQLPSVGAGNILKDLIGSNCVDTITLNQIFRQAQESKIITNAHKILNGYYPDIKTKTNDFFFLQRLNNEKALDTILELWKDRLPKTYKYNPLDDIQILSPSRKGVLGTINLNKMAQDLINPHKKGDKELKNALYSFRVGDKVMQIKNNYDITWEKDNTHGSGIYNGDMGIITNISNDTLEINFDGRSVTYDIELIDQLELAYAITIHKSQGSEFKAVIMPMLNNFYTLSYRSLLYTAVTRAKNLLIVVGSFKELFRMVDNNKPILRYTCLKDMIINECE
ncbi:MAG: ATP-dependent RecD-like DNA helicase [Oscillospiraceae bacterium]